MLIWYIDTCHFITFVNFCLCCVVMWPPSSLECKLCFVLFCSSSYLTIVLAIVRRSAPAYFPPPLFLCFVIHFCFYTYVLYVFMIIMRQQQHSTHTAILPHLPDVFLWCSYFAICFEYSMCLLWFDVLFLPHKFIYFATNYIFFV